MKAIKGAIFDLDGTLLDSLWVWRDVDINFLGKRNITVSDEYVKAICTMGFEGAADYTIEQFGLDETPEEVIAEWFALAVEEYSDHVELKPGAKEYLSYLKNSGIKLAVATSSDPGLYEPALKNNGIYELFDEIVSVCEVERDKSYPDIYEEAARRLALQPSECMVFEDILKGIRSAKQGGFRTVAVYDEHATDEAELIEKEADLYISGFSKLTV